MRRKIVKLGPATLVVSLPAKWVKKTNIKAGNEIDMIEQEKDLIISATGILATEKKAQVDLRELNNLLKRIVAAKYLAGYDEIRVLVKDIKSARTIQKRIKDLIGMAVISHGKDFLIIKEISKTSDLSFDAMIRRLFLLIKSIGEESLTAFEQKQTNLDYIADMEDNVNNFTDYCFRILNKKGFTEYSKTPVMYCITNNLELIGDEHKRLLDYITKNKIKLNTSLIDIYKNINLLFDQLYNLFYNFSNKKAIALANNRDSILKKIQSSQLKTDSPKEMAVLKNFENIAELIVGTMGHILTIS